MVKEKKNSEKQIWNRNIYKKFLYILKQHQQKEPKRAKPQKENKKQHKILKR